MKKIIIALIFEFLFTCSFYAQVTDSNLITYPESFYTLREIYIDDNILVRTDAEKVFETAMADAKSITDMGNSLIVQAKCLWLYGSTFHTVEVDENTFKSYIEKALETIEEASKYTESAELYLVWSEIISQGCLCMPVNWILTVGSKQQKMAKKTLEMDPAYGAAQYEYNRQYAWMPSPFNNYKRALTEMQKLIDDPTFRKDKWDLINANSAIAYVYYCKKEWDKSLSYTNAVLELAPNNKYWIEFKKDLLSKIS